MLYLGTEIGVRTLKIGFTERTESERKTEYETCSTVFRIIDTLEGTKEDERNWQIFLESLGFVRYYEDKEKSEWYVMPKWVDKRKLMKLGFDYFTNLK